MHHIPTWTLWERGVRVPNPLAHCNVHPVGVQGFEGMPSVQTLRVQVLKKHILIQALYTNYDYQNPKYLIIGYIDPKP